MSDDAIRIRATTADDIAAMEALIVDSARALSRGYYSEAEIEAAITHVFGVDSQLVADGTYLLAEDADGMMLGCGGWSRRRTLFGGDRFAARDGGMLDPATDAARIRAFFVAPQAARRGVGRALLQACEDRAAAAGFRHFQLMATLPGVPLYAAHGYVPDAPVLHPCGAVVVRFVPMGKTLLLQK